MSKFVLTAQLQLTPPTNTQQVVNQMRGQLSGVNVPVNATGAAAATKQMKTLNTGVKQVQSSAYMMGKTFAASFKRFAAFSIATRIIGGLTHGLSEAISAAVQFERQMIKISQVTGKTMSELQGLTREITKLSTGLGVASKDLVDVSRILSQAGMSANETKTALASLAKTTLAATFDDIKQTAEGAVAIFNQFGQGAAALEQQLGAINAVAGQFAVEAGDLIAVIRRTGGVFKAAGGDLNELVALFTSVRATTRESAESIATGLRTIFTRIQRPRTLEFLKQFGVELVDLNGKFVGPFEAVKRLSNALAGLEQGDIKFVQIAEQLGGFRQIGKVIPLLQQFAVSQEALKAAMEGQDSLAKDAAQAQEALSVKILKVKEQFADMMREIVGSAGFQAMIGGALELAKAFIAIGKALKDVIPLLTVMMTMKMAAGMRGFMAGFGGGMKGGIPRFARGGMVPGQGNKDTVPAMLTPGEFVIQKDSVNKIGASNLYAMNNGMGYAHGGVVRSNRNFYQGTGAAAAGAALMPGAGGRFGISGAMAPGAMTGGAAYGQIRSSALGKIEALDGLIDSTVEAKEGTLFDDYGAAYLRPYGVAQMLTGQLDAAALKAEVNSDPNIEAIRALATGLSDTDPAPAAAINKEINQIISRLITGKSGSFQLHNQSLQQAQGEKLEDHFTNGVYNAVQAGAKILQGDLGIGAPLDGAKLLKQINIDQVMGNLFEGALTQAGFSHPFEQARDAANASFDFPKGLGAAADNFPTIPKGMPTDAKSTYSMDNVGTFIKKVKNFDLQNNIRPSLDTAIAEWTGKIKTELMEMEGLSGTALTARLRGKGSARTGGPDNARQLLFRNKGGSVDGTDSVPAMLTPGEFVINRKAANRIGYGNLHSMNRNGVAKFAHGGIVRGNKGNYGFMPGAGPMNMPSLQMPVNEIISAATVFSAELQKLGMDMLAADRAAGVLSNALMKGATGPEALSVALQGTTLTMDQFKAHSAQAMAAAGGAATADAAEATSSIAASEADMAEAAASKGAGMGGGGMMMGAMSMAMMAPMMMGGGEEDSDEPKTKMQELTKGFGEMIMPVAMVGMMLPMLTGGITALTGTIMGLTGAAVILSGAFKKAEEAALKKAIADGNVTKAGEKSLDVGRQDIAMKAGIVAGGLSLILAMRFLSRAKRKEAREAKKAIKQKKKDMRAERRINKKGAKAAFKKARSDLKAARSVRRQGAAGRKAARDFIKSGKAARDAGRSMKKAARGGRRGGGVGGMAIAGGLLTIVPVFLALLGSIVASLGLFKGAFDTARNWLSKMTGGLIKSTATLENEARIKALSVVAEKAKEQAAKDLEKALKSLKDGTISATDAMNDVALAAGTMAEIDVALEKGAGTKGVLTQDMSDKDKGFLGMAWFGIAKNMKKAQEDERKREAELPKAVFDGMDKSMTPFVKEQAKMMSFGAGGQADRGKFMDQIMSSGQMQELEKKRKEAMARGDLVAVQSIDKAKKQLEEKWSNMFDNIQEETKRQIDRMKALNLGLRDLEAAAAASSLRLNNFMSSLQVGFSPLQNSVNVVSAAMTTAGAAIGEVEFNAAMADVEKQLAQLNIGGQDVSKFTQSLKAMAHTQRNLGAIFDDDFKKKMMKEMGAGGMSTDKLREVLANKIGDSLSAAGFGEEARKGIMAQIEGVDLSQEDVAKLMTGDFSVITDKLGDLTKEAQEKLQAMMKQRIEQEKALVKLTQDRIKAERSAIDAAKKAIDIQSEAMDIIAKSGGPQVTPEQRREMIRRKANVGSARLGVGALADTTIGSLRKRRQELGTGFAQAEGRLRTASGRAGTGGVETAERQKDINKAMQDHLGLIRSLVKENEKSLKILEKKNQLEKESLEALIKGDMESFFQKQAATGATAALALNDRQLANMFGADALAAAFENVQKMAKDGVAQIHGVDIREMERRGASAALSARGVNDPQMALLLANQTAEQEAIRAEQRLLAGELAATGEDMVKMAEMNVQTAILNIQQAHIAGQIQNPNQLGPSPPAAGGVPGMASGGVVYANQGMFVPRGTDTVPAMLTPGEFVVNRSAVQRGNNLQILRTMNGTRGYSQGGRVRYYQHGDVVDGGGGMGLNPEVLNNFSKALNTFNQDLSKNIENLNKMKFKIKLDTTNVNVNINGGSFLASLKDSLKDELLQEMGEQIKTLEFDHSGKARLPRIFKKQR